MFKDACTKEKFKLEYNHPEDFTRCYWQKQQKVLPIWIAYRAILVMYFFLAILVIFAMPEEGTLWYKNFIFYTYWVYFVELSGFTIALIITVQRYRLEKKNPEIPPMEKLPVLYKILWCFYNIAAPCSVVVTVLFWLFVYNPEVYPFIGFILISRLSNSVFIVLDFILYAIPYRFVHFYIPVIYSCCYAIFTLIYQFSGGTGERGKIPIYNILDWRDPKVALTTCVIHTTSVTLVHAAYCVMNLLKHWKKTAHEGT